MREAVAVGDSPGTNRVFGDNDTVLAGAKEGIGGVIDAHHPRTLELRGGEPGGNPRGDEHDVADIRPDTGLVPVGNIVHDEGRVYVAVALDMEAGVIRERGAKRE